MSNGWLYVLAAAAVVLLAVAALAYAVRRAQVRTTAELAAARAEADELRQQLARLEERLTSASDAAGVSTRSGAERLRGSTNVRSEFVITALPEEPSAAEPVPTVEPRLFADIVARESTIKAASFVQGLRRALAPETRNRIRFEMKREIRRARKQRRAELREARRELLARKRAEIRLEQEGSAA